MNYGYYEIEKISSDLRDDLSVNKHIYTLSDDPSVNVLKVEG
jgi:hypothetical protein